MTMRRYLAELYRMLSFRYNKTEMEDILTEYRSFFEAGLAEGKTEEELCRGFGFPREAALSLREEYKPPLLSDMLIRRLTVCGLILVLLAAAGYCFSGVIAVELAVIGVLWFVLWFFLGGRLRSLPPYAYKERSSIRWVLLAHGLTLIWAVVAAVCNRAIYWTLYYGYRNSPLFVQGFVYGSVALTLALVVWGMYGFLRLRPEFYSVICHAGGGLYAALFLFIPYYNNITGPEQLRVNLIYSGVAYLVGVAAATFFHIFIGTLGRRRDEWTLK